MARERRKIGEILIQWGLLDDRKLKEAMKIAEGTRGRLGEILVKLGYCTSSDVAKALASQFDMQFVDLNQPNAIPKEALPLIPDKVIKKYQVLPLGREGGKLRVLVHDPMDLELIDNLRFVLSTDIELALAAKDKIKEYIDHVFSETRTSIDKAVRELSVDRGQSLDASGMSVDMAAIADEEKMSAEEKAANQAPIIRLVNQIIAEAVVSRASDIHMECFGERVRVRYRIDGVCHERESLPKRVQGAVIARIKIMARMRVEEKRIPQDGRIKLKIGGKIVDFRASTCPIYHGESIVLRVLRSESASLGLEKLGMDREIRERFDRIINRPNGIFLVTGPTGSGKTTTLYSALQVLNRPDKKIITAEDPIEYNFKGINQCQVNAEIGLTFQRILKAMLRQAPNIVLVGEIRDQEVGEVAIEAALTGHLVFSTLHTNDAPSAITRLIDMGIKPFLVASSIQAVLAQRLIRRICPECREPSTKFDPEVLALCGIRRADLKDKVLYKAKGCNKCSGTGYRGRMAVHELMLMTPDIREMAFQRATVSSIRKASKAAGFSNLLDDGKKKAFAGLTTLDEVARIAQVEGTVQIEPEDEEEI